MKKRSESNKLFNELKKNKNLFVCSIPSYNWDIDTTPKTETKSE